MIRKKIKKKITKKSTRKKSTKRTPKRRVSRRNPVSLIEIAPESPVNYKGNLFKVDFVDRVRDMVKIVDFRGRTFTVGSKDLDHPKVRPPTEIETIFQRAQDARIPKFVEYSDYLVQNSQIRIEIMIFRKLNSAKTPITKWHYGIDIISVKERRRFAKAESEKLENFLGYDSESDAKRAAISILNVKYNLNVPRTISAVTENRIVPV